MLKGDNMGLRVGIDLGTTYSAVAKVDGDGVARVIKNAQGATTTPSVLCFLADGRVAFGEEAKEYQEEGSPNVASFFKRSMGENSCLIESCGKEYTASDLSGIFLEKIIRDAETTAGEKIDSAIITVPAYFGARERQATIAAGEKAGINVLGLLSEPSAAAFAYGLTGDEEPKTALIYDLGGGTFDVTIARIEQDEVRVLGCDGNHKLGGKDWDDALARFLVDLLAEELDVDPYDLSLSPSEMNALLVKAEQAKRQLSSRESVKLQVTAGGETGVVSITREEFAQATESLLRMTTTLVEKLLGECELRWNNIDGTILVGGSTRMPAVANFLREATGKEPLKGINPDEAVALGAAIKANLNEKSTYSLGGSAAKYKLKGAKTLVDSTAHAMGMVAESSDRKRYINSTIIPKNAAIPAHNSKSCSLRVPARGGFLEVYVLQGDADRVLDNVLYAKYVVSGIERENGKESVVEVSYGYTENATIEVTAKQPATGKTLPVEQCEPEEDLSRFDGSPLAYEEEKIKTAGSQVTQRILLALDVSGSMIGEPLEQAKSAMRGFVSELEDTEASVGCMVFSNRNQMEVKPAPIAVRGNANKIRSAISQIRINGDVGYGNAADPIAYWLDEVRRAEPVFSSGEKYHDCLIVLTDGVWGCRDHAVRSAEKAADAGHDIIAIGFGGADQRFLEQIATCSDYATLVDASKLAETFSTIGRTMAAGGGLSLA